MKEVVLTGLRTNGNYHLGNYIGAILPLLRLINQRSGQYQINVFVPELHSFTTPVDFKNLYRQSRINLALFVACGIPLDKPDVFIYRQSYLSAHSEFNWILSNFAGFGDLARMVEFKDKAQRLGQDRVGLGLFSYPVLMAADILLYDARWVPVGDDQRQHLEFTRKLASQFNRRFGQLLTVPATAAQQQQFFGVEPPRIRSLKNPQQKMSKSLVDPKGTIELFDSPEQVAKKIRAATTDNQGRINYDWDRQPGVTNLLTILASLTAIPPADIKRDWVGQSNYTALKQAVIEAVQITLAPIQAAWKQVDAQALDRHLEASEAQLEKVSQAKLAQVWQAIGLRP